MIKVAPGVYELPNGKHLVRVQHEGRRVNRVVPDLVAALSLRAALLHELASGELEAVSGDSFQTLGAAFLRSLKGRDVRNPRSRWEAHVLKAPFAAQHIRTVEPADVLDWVESIPGSWQLRKHVLNLLRAFYNWALRRRIVTANPCADLRIARADGDEDEGWQASWYLDPDEQARLLEAVEADDAEAARMVAIALGTGMRLGELLCLHVEDVHESHVLVKYGSWDPKAERYRPPKGKAGSKRERLVALFGDARAAMVAQLAELEARAAALPAGAKKRATHRSQNPLGLVFPSRWGGRRTKPPKAFTEAAARLAVARLGGDGHAWWHLLRHTCATALCTGWWGKRWDVRDVQQHLGHSSIATTQRYAHLVDSLVVESSTKAHAAWTRGNAVAMVGLARSARKPRKLGRSPLESNQQPAASKADELALSSGDHDPRCHAVATALAALQAVQDGEPTALARCVDALGLCLRELQAGAVTNATLATPAAGVGS